MRSLIAEAVDLIVSIDSSRRSGRTPVTFSR